MPNLGQLTEDPTSGIDDSSPELHSGRFKPEDLSNDDQKEYLRSIGKRNKYSLVELSEEERKRVGNHIIDEYDKAMPEHELLCQKIDEWDEVSRLIRKEVTGSQGEIPNYRMPFSFLTHEVIHSNIMNTFFSPQEIMRVIPTAVDDISKTNNISVFGNWSMKNEMDIFTRFDMLNHASIKNGESVAMIYWKKEYGVEVQRIPMKDEEGNVMYDEETKDPIYQEKEVDKIIYNAPCMEIISRKDYVQPPGCLMEEKPEWEACIRRFTYDSFLRDEEMDKYYEDTIAEIKNWPSSETPAVEKQTLDGEDIKIPAWSKEFLLWFGRMRVSIVKDDVQEDEQIEIGELEDEFEAIVHIRTKTLCSFKKNRRPMKERPFVNDYFQPDDTGRRCGIGVYEIMDPLQKCYDAVFNNYVYGEELSNNPIVFFSPTGNMRDERFKIQKGYAYPTSDPKSVQLFQFPQPNESSRALMDLVQQWGQFMFGISDYAAGMQSNIDPSASGKKVQLIVDQGNVRLNMIIKRKNNVLKEIFKRWFLLYRDNMPPNKFMRIAGEQKDPWKFEAINYEDFALQSIPDFELTGNVLNANKQLEANKAIATYQLLITNALFNPATQQGLRAYTQLSKWLIDKIGDAQLSNFVGGSDDEGVVLTPEEENALMLQGEEDVDPHPGEDIAHHLLVHKQYLEMPYVPDQVKTQIAKHMQATLLLAKQLMVQKLAMMQAGQDPATGLPAGQQPNQGQPGANGGQPGAAPQIGNPMITNKPKVGQGMSINRMGSVNKVGAAGTPGAPGNALPV